MFDVRHLRPVSGEIMTDVGSRPSIDRGTADIEDAEFEIVLPGTRNSGSPAEAPRGHRQANEPAAPQVGMDMLRSGMDVQGGALASERAGPLFWTTGAVVALAAFWTSGGHSLAGTLLARLQAVGTEPLRIVELTSRIEEHGGRRFLIVDGRVENAAAATLKVPSLDIEVAGDTGLTTRYRLDAAEAMVEPGEDFRFSSRVNAPLGAIAGVSVRMAKGER